ncbi:hypothetical protein B0H17DRAFT_1142956 [Mycena rosella]|uniref:Uncharacterized protein n=1 Tax=Mycena rosella TaxID=1033263 RepID=A0AAD7CZZ5_MYCRO|nr:hypothetical protein B0H17DRAFT_1142956 [Mycena rosella]
MTYTLPATPSVLPNGDLESEHAAVLNSLRPKSRLIFERYIRVVTSPSWYEVMLARREFMKARGTPINRPLPLDMLAMRNIASRRAAEASTQMPPNRGQGAAVQRSTFNVRDAHCGP